MKHKVLDHGFIELVNKMGDEFDICKSARVSYAANSKDHSELQNIRLLQYLIKNNHTSPFEMIQLQFHVKLPIFVARQWMRHRTGTFNEISARYSELPDDFYIPETIEKQSKTNNQGRGERLSLDIEIKSKDILLKNSKECYNNYKQLLNDGVAKEIARSVLPVNIYTEFYWSVNLHNLLHFLKLRMDSHSQLEIREYAISIYNNYVKLLFPNISNAYEEYIINSITLYKKEKDFITSYLRQEDKSDLMTEKEWDQFVNKLIK